MMGKAEVDVSSFIVFNFHRTCSQSLPGSLHSPHLGNLSRPHHIPQMHNISLEKTKQLVRENQWSLVFLFLDSTQSEIWGGNTTFLSLCFPYDYFKCFLQQDSEHSAPSNWFTACPTYAPRHRCAVKLPSDGPADGTLEWTVPAMWCRMCYAL